MEEVIKQAIKGGYEEDGFDMEYLANNALYLGEQYRVVCNPLFWQALAKACGWTNNEKVKVWKFNAHEFHEINLTEGWDKAVEYLLELIKN